MALPTKRSAELITKCPDLKQILSDVIVCIPKLLQILKAVDIKSTPEFIEIQPKRNVRITTEDDIDIVAFEANVHIDTLAGNIHFNGRQAAQVKDVPSSKAVLETGRQIAEKNLKYGLSMINPDAHDSRDKAWKDGKDTPPIIKETEKLCNQSVDRQFEWDIHADYRKGMECLRVLKHAGDIYNDSVTAVDAKRA